MQDSVNEMSELRTKLGQCEYEKSETVESLTKMQTLAQTDAETMVCYFKLISLFF